MRKNARTISLLAIVGLAWLGFRAGTGNGEANAHHSYQEKNFFQAVGIGLPLTNNDYFQASGRCDGCHGFDPTGFANTSSEGTDISPIQMWRGSMMANSSKDPFWKAKVSHEVTVNPSHKAALEDKCTTCHAPMANYSYQFFGMGQFPIDSLATDSLALDGVSCLACHKQTTENLGNNHSGELHFTSAPIIFGPHGKPFTPPMQEFVGMEPFESQHIRDAGLCAGCHTLLTESVDLNGNFTGSTFVEQATYHEWLNSDFNDDDGDGITCQGCHMPENNDGVVLSANYSFLPDRSPVGLHEMAGANLFMLRLMRNNWQALGLWADETDFDRTISATIRMLRDETSNVDLQLVGLNSDTAYFEFKIENLAGHKFPSGYPSRRAFVELLVTDISGNTIFHSGQMGSDNNLTFEPVNFEPHHNIIHSPSQTQIYEIVMGDVNGNFTTVLERGFQPLKDNRLVPKGFSTSHNAYDTTMIIGNALLDSDFNVDQGLSGSGTDVVHYHVPLNEFTGTIKALARLRYQTLPPRWTTEMFALNTDPVNTFRDLYENADGVPFQVGADSIMNINVITAIDQLVLQKVQIFPNPVRNGNLRINLPSGIAASSLELMDSNGRRMAIFGPYTSSGIDLTSVSKGLYLLRISTNKGDVLRKVIVQN